MNNKKIDDLFENHMWEQLARSYSPHEIAKYLSFEDGLRVAYRLLYNDLWDASLQVYAAELLSEVSKVYPKDWNKSWEYNALLGLAYYIARKYDERYKAYKNAFDRATEPPPRLLIELARCCICPGHPPISYDDAIDLVMKAIKDAPYADGIGLLSHIYSIKEDKKNEEYWTNILRISNQEFVSPPIEPKFLIEEYLRDVKDNKIKNPLP